jgi:Flp pilus assembly protein TadB
MEATPNKGKTDATNGAKAKAKPKRAAKPRVTAAQRAAEKRTQFNEAIGRVAKRVPFVDNPPQAGEASTVACAIVNSVLHAVAVALVANRLTAEDVLAANALFLRTAGVEEIEAPMGGTTFQRVAKPD